MVIKACSCGRSYDSRAWRKLAYVGNQDRGTGRASDVMEMRLCACGSSLVVEPAAARAQDEPDDPDEPEPSEIRSRSAHEADAWLRATAPAARPRRS